MNILKWLEELVLKATKSILSKFDLDHGHTQVGDLKPSLSPKAYSVLSKNTLHQKMKEEFALRALRQILSVSDLGH